MKEKPLPHDWAAYYQAAYEKEKKKNILLAGKIADVEAKEADLAFRLDRIQGSIFWKLSAPVRKCYYMLKGGNGSAGMAQGVSGNASSTATETDRYVQEYYREVFRQKHPYLQWIGKYEKTEENEKSADNTNRNTCNCMDAIEPVEPIESIDSVDSMGHAHFVNGWQKIDFKNSDICVIIHGHGILNSKTEEKVKLWFNKNKDCIFAYTDEDYYWKKLSNRMHPWFKPCWSPDTLLSFCYMGHMILAKQSLFNDVLEQYQYQSGSYADFYDLCLRLEEKALFQEEGNRVSRIGHIEEVLFHNCYEPDLAPQRQIEEAEQSGQDVLETVENLLQMELEQGRDMTGCDASFRNVREAALRRRGIKAHLEPGADPDIYHVVYETEDGRGESHRAESDGTKPGMVSVIIPSKDHPKVLERCLSSFRDKTDYENYEWIVVDNGSSPENKSCMETLQKEYGFYYLYEQMEFNFSAMCNLGAQKAKGEYLLLLNDDIEIMQKDWLRIMVGQAGQPHVGAVGAKLWYADSNLIQHVGITNLQIGPSHKLASLSDDRNYYYGRNLVTYDMIGVTAACLLIERKKYQEVGGMDETMKVAYNDVDFCFKLIEAGYYNVLRNDAVLYHAESLSRGSDEADAGKWDRLLLEKENLYAKHPDMRGVDNFYHKYLIDNDINYTCNFKPGYNMDKAMSDIYGGNAGKLTKAKQGILQLTIDQAGMQRRMNFDERDILVITGWSYIPGEDNAGYTRNIILQREDGTICCAVPFPWYRKDVEMILTNEVNILLSGFAVRFPKEALEPGTWKIGMLAENGNSQGMGGHKQFLTWSDKQIVIKEYGCNDGKQ